AYEYMALNWVVDNISSAPTDVLSVAIGDADNDGSNDVVFGMMETSNEIRLFKKNGVFSPTASLPQGDRDSFKLQLEALQ
ncbi:MAG: hypothetical protein ACFE7R_06090, partial [Candidatus Hodarchaeota archaeon]